MKKETKEQVDLLKKYGVTNYTVEGDKITINGNLYLDRLESIPDSNFLRGTTINGSLSLSSLTSIPDSNFLRGTTINGHLSLGSLAAIPDSNFLRETTINGRLYLISLAAIPDSNFLKGATINGYLDLGSLTSIPDSNFLQGTTINGSLGLNSLTSIPDSKFLIGTTINGYLFLASLSQEQRESCQDNVTRLQRGYNAERGYCFFDGILSKVLSIKETNGYTIYTTPFHFIAHKGDFTAHAKTIKQAILDVEFKIVREKIKNEPIKADDLMTVEKYRLITGACDIGCRNFMQANNIPFEVVEGKTVEREPMMAKDLMKLLEETRPYGYEKIKSLVTFDY